LANLPVYQPGRPIDEVARELGLPVDNVLKLASNENPLGPSPAALAAMEKALQQLHLYPDGNAYYLKKRLVEKLGVPTDQIVLGNGSNEIIEFIAHALITPGSEVVMSQYCFAVYPIVTLMMGARPVVVPARDYGHDLPAMAQAVNSKTRVVFVANPNNPTGTWLPAREIHQFLEAVPDNVLIAMDEAYIEFCDDPVDLLPLIRENRKPNLLLMRTFSKIYGLAGLRVGYGIGEKELVTALEKVRQPFNVNALAQVAARAALDDTEHVLRTRQNNAEGLRTLEAACKRLRLDFVPSHANFLLIKVGNGQKIFELMQRQGVISRPMGGYQLPEWIRISVGTPEEIRRCIAVLESVM
jgi:histidinol-phosphate aminotransferase